MKLFCSAGIVVAILSITGTDSFLLNSPPKPAATSCTPSSTTRLFLNSWGSKGAPYRLKNEVQDPAENMASYLKEPEPVPLRSNLDGTVLVSGWVDSKERSDQTVFDLLNKQKDVGDVSFEFQKIVAFVNDAKFAKKRLISRSARYTGLLNKLEFVQAETEGALPTAEQLDGVKSWVANASDGGLQRLQEITERAGEAPATLENLSILLTNGQDSTDVDKINETLDILKKTCTEKDITYTVVVVGAIREDANDAPYRIKDYGNYTIQVEPTDIYNITAYLNSRNSTNITAAADGITPPEEDLTIVLPSEATFGRDESLRLLTECLGIAAGENRAFQFQEIDDVNATETKLIQGLRESGYSRTQEINHMITIGVKGYEKACKDFGIRMPRRRGSAEWDNFMEKERKKAKEDSKDRDKRMVEEYANKKNKEVEKHAREWAKREYYRKTMSGDMAFSEDEYIASIWERAMFEGDMTWRMQNGRPTDERKELAEFKMKQQEKKMAQLDTAKANLDRLVDEEKKDEDDDDDKEDNDDKE